eukprot:gene11625-13571_t
MSLFRLSGERGLCSRLCPITAMPTRFSKHRKSRGDVCAGYGRVGKHRKHPGGRGNAGAIQVISVSSKIWTLVPETVRKTLATKADGSAPVVDVTQRGFFKVLGHGILPNQPIIVKARYFSKIAEKKIKAAGGACVLIA